MAGRGTLLEQPMYLELVRRYQNNPKGFLMGVMGMRLSEDQMTLADALINPVARVSVVSGTTTGKTAAMGGLALWHLLMFPYATVEGKAEIGSNTWVGAAKVKQVAGGVWKEMHDCLIRMRSGPVPWLADFVTIGTEAAYVNDYKSVWYIGQFACQKGQSVSVAGKHRYWQMILVDEAIGVEDEHFEVINNTQSMAGNRTILLSQGSRTAGFFYDTHHNLRKENGGIWTALQFSSERSPFVTRKWLKEIEHSYGGKDSSEYRVRIAGEFVQKDQETLLTRQELEGRIDTPPVVKAGDAWGWMLCVDVGGGEYRDYTAGVLCRVVGGGEYGDDARRVDYVGLPIWHNDQAIGFTRGQVLEVIREHPGCTVYVDFGGGGGQLIKLLAEDGVDVHRVQWGNKPHKNEDRQRYYNERASSSFKFRNAIRDGRVSFLKDYKRGGKMRAVLLDQGSRLPYHYTDDKALLKMVSKPDMLAQGIKSPDLIDAMCYPFLDRAYYNVSESAFMGEYASKEELTIDAALRDAEDMFAAVE